MPAAAVIPAPIAYTNVVAVKKLVVGFLTVVGLVRPRVASTILLSTHAMSWCGQFGLIRHLIARLL